MITRTHYCSLSLSGALKPSKQTALCLVLLVVEARAGLPCLGEVHVDSAAADLGLVHGLHGLLGRGLLLEGDEAEPPGRARE